MYPSVGSQQYTATTFKLIANCFRGASEVNRHAELFLFDAQGQGKKLEGPTKVTLSAQYVEAVKGLVTHVKGNDLFFFLS